MVRRREEVRSQGRLNEARAAAAEAQASGESGACESPWIADDCTPHFLRVDARIATKGAEIALRDRRRRTAAAHAARLSADARDVAQGRAARSPNGTPSSAAISAATATRRSRRAGSKHVNYSKRAMAADQVELMRTLGFTRFRLAGHDRGARVSHRLCVDHPDAVERVAVLDISPTRIMYGKTDQAFATAYYHWFFLIQPFDLPEKLIGADPAVLPAQEDERMGLGGRTSSILAHTPSTSVASATRRRSTQHARTTARPRRSISSTTTPTSRRAAR